MVELELVVVAVGVEILPEKVGVAQTVLVSVLVAS